MRNEQQFIQPSPGRRPAQGLLWLLAAGLGVCQSPPPVAPGYPVVDTGQSRCYDDRREIRPPQPGQPFYGQDAQYQGRQPSYRDNGDGTVSDLQTGLMWVRARGEKITWNAALAGAAACRVGGHKDWRMPTTKELYSLIRFDGGFDYRAGAAGSRPYLDTNYFQFVYGDEAKGERGIDCQDWSATEYVGTTMNGNATVFGVNFADGRIKGYPKVARGPGGRAEAKTLFVRYVRGNPAYGQNDFHDHGDGTITDRATGLVWQKADSGKPLNWQQALAYAENLKLAGREDWRLPNAKELQSLVDYRRAPDALGQVLPGPAINPIFQVTEAESYFWTSTTHLDGPRDRLGDQAVYVCFGRSLGYMARPGSTEKRLINVHGAGAQRSDPKSGDPRQFPQGRGPQGDDVRIFNYARGVRGGDVVRP